MSEGEHHDSSLGTPAAAAHATEATETGTVHAERAGRASTGETSTTEVIKEKDAEVDQADTASTNNENAKSGAADLERNGPLVTEGEKAREPQEFEVWWDSDKDPQNPQNWSSRRKWATIFILSCITFLTLVPFSQWHLKGKPHII